VGLWLAKAVAVLGAAAGAPRIARAGDNDLVLSRLGDVVTDSAGDPVGAVGDGESFRSLASELGVVLAPRLSEPADTLGFGGFQFTADVGMTQVHTDRSYWRALAGSPDPAGSTMAHGDDFMTTVGVFARKGIWLPLPSFEVGVGAVHLVDSRLWCGQVYAKLALLEGYHELPLPSVAVRGAASRMMGSDEMHLTVASIDVSASKEFGVAGTFSAAPYAGWNWLIVIPRSESIDRTPQIDPSADPADQAMTFQFPDQDDIHRQRFFGGVKLKYYVFMISVEGALALAGSSVDDRPGTSQDCSAAAAPTADCDSTDQAGQQGSFTVTGGFDF
jgi:hypothetical protein